MGEDASEGWVGTRAKDGWGRERRMGEDESEGWVGTRAKDGWG